MYSVRLVPQALQRSVLYSSRKTITRWKSPAIASRGSRLSQCRTARTASTFNTPADRMRGWVKDASNDYPFLFPFLLVGCTLSLSLLALLAYDQAVNVDPKFAAYPPSVEEKLRRALHFTHVDPDPDEASRLFKEALKYAELEGMDPFSKEVMGTRIRFAEMLESFGRVKAAAGLLQGIVRDSEQRLREVDESNKRTEQAQEIRSGLLRGIIQAKVKISALYESEYIQNPSAAKEVLSSAIDLLLKETSEVNKSGLSENNAAGLSLSEIASMLSQMGDLYATTGEESNAIQAYMLTLGPLRQSCNGKKTCKEVQILSNIASTMTVALKRPGATVNGKPITEALRSSSRRVVLKWADNAIQTMEEVHTAERDQMCELGLISAQMTKADLMLESGEKQQAREIFRDLIPRLREKNLDALVGVAQQGLERAEK